ncbi:deoxyribodipyrimidine photo-lyase [Fructobacillus evanidus]|uniref:Deoxyribodipyrimidine photolyase (PhrB) n=1 Tax=Fructobacillus evanidus TaxID=3064281 RepID=A0ABN9YVE4_9LACO|nr:Deoxyribodipyrimidine photolyase (PhrB) [Fructobacillus sp. LMG 32999]CAK1237182.1 Deoxyribodipyrimidine photolyase (PhrB) [Fructobacillus sp. LMG 32999]CAK1241710.1 Deoxyribodipyrimidine photolyase (PhrB) [Fructobacillus sp. LMG 32999]CAK1244667.1 Deoxyribodipyrimidine photolyase (PhrB) [Fructobacillus sp. LMG 32999]CAK1246811.1 Deoxyribodipyrimidine photolyase (PhrB) [Fructobacillus sp. LMG 32999]
MTKASIMWFRRDLRLTDNRALHAAMQKSDQVIFIFIIDPKQIQNNASVNQSAFFASVLHFKETLAKNNITLLIQTGPVIDVVTEIKTKVPSVSDIYLNFDERGYGRKRDQQTIRHLSQELGIVAHPFLDFTLTSASSIKKQDGSAYQIFTPYYKKWLSVQKDQPLPSLTSTEIQDKQVAEPFEDHIDDLKKLINPNHSYAYQDSLGEQQAVNTLEDFVSNKLADYDQNRDIPALDGTSHLSRYLRTGEISIRTVYDAVSRQPASLGKETFIKELCWRDFYNMIYTIYPNQKDQAINTKFQTIPWINNESQFNAWKNGTTGFPIIDAAMQQLNQTGWLHNRLRMIVASFLTKDLLINWTWGEQYFQEKLVDYDPASNIGGWQWAASTGTDSVPYFRIFNPFTQAEKFDPDAKFIKQYIPALADLPADKIHHIDRLSEADQQQYQVILGKDYPKPIVDHALARKRAIASYKNLNA